MMGPDPEAVAVAALKGTTLLNTPTPVTVEYEVAIRSLLDIIKFGLFTRTEDESTLSSSRRSQKLLLQP